MQSRDFFYAIYIKTYKSWFLLHKANPLFPSVFFFFSSNKYKETHVVDSQPPRPLTCKSWSSNKNTRDGKVIQLTDSKTSIGTSNKVKIDYSWSATCNKSGFVQNSYLNIGVVVYGLLKAFSFFTYYSFDELSYFNRLLCHLHYDDYIGCFSFLYLSQNTTVKLTKFETLLRV